MYPNLGKTCLEIGVGGGRVAKRTAPLTEELHLVDISAEMLRRSKATLSSFEHIRYHHSTESPAMPPKVQALKFDFVYSFDVFVHCDIHTFYQTLLCVKAVLKPRACFFVTVANLCSQMGFDRFKKQKNFKVAGFYCKPFSSHSIRLQS